MMHELGHCGPKLILENISIEAGTRNVAHNVFRML
jgi:hypothetical protein